MDTNTTPTLVPLPALPKTGRGPRAKTNDCACGCGQKTGTTFVPGHDSRLRGWMLRLERGIVTVQDFPGTAGELAAAQKALASKRRKEGKDAAPVTSSTTVIDKVPQAKAS